MRHEVHQTQRNTPLQKACASKPEITLSRALELFWTLAHDRTLRKSRDQLRIWKNGRIKAVTNLINIVGDKPIADITGDDVLDFRQWWLDKMAAENLTANSANKDMSHVSNILRTVNKLKRLSLELPLSDLSIKEGDKKTRPAFSTEWIAGKILAPGALDGLNIEARAILLGLVNTGYRPSEGACLTSAQIILDHAVPHISIEPVGRQLKSQYAKRKIPLLGVSLEAFRSCPDGFPRYRDGQSLSATINKFMRENGLMETPEHTLYGIRHAFEDRMLRAGIDGRVRRDLFGHSLTRERYGQGASLEQARELLSPVAL